jgi:hypothetical protein
MGDRDSGVDRGNRVATGAWADEGVATLEAVGTDLRSALESGLQAALALANGRETSDGEVNATRSVPIRGEGDDLATLFADLLDDLFAQLEEHGSGLCDVALDGLLHRDRGGFVAWGYASIADEAVTRTSPPRLHGTPTLIVDEPSRVVIRATLARP